MRRMWRLSLGDERGAIFLSGLVLVMIMTILGVSLFSLSRIEGGLATSDVVSRRLLYCAEAGLGRTLNDLSAGGRVDQILTAMTTPGSTLTFNDALPDPLNSARIMCSNTIVFTDVANAACPGGRCRYLTTTSVAPGGIQRSVRVQLLSSLWQNWTAANENNQPYWDGNSSDSPQVGNVGSWLSNTGLFLGGSGPGVRYPFMGNPYNPTPDTGGAQLPSLFFHGNGGTVTFKAEFTAYNGQSGTTPDTFGWFESDVNGNVGTLHPLFTNTTANYTTNTTLGLIAGPQPVNLTFSSSATKYYGFYLSNKADGTHASTMYTLSTQQGNNNGVSKDTFQHFALFRQDANTYWIGVEDLLIANSDKDYQDMIFKFVVPAGDAVITQLPAPAVVVPPLTWQDWQECPPCS